MKVEIQNTVARQTEQRMIFRVVSVAQKANNLNELNDLLEERRCNLCECLDFGRGSNHIWVSTNSNNERVLLITA